MFDTRWRQHSATYTVVRSSTATSSLRTFLSGHLSAHTQTPSFQQSSSWPTTASVVPSCHLVLRALLELHRSWHQRSFSTMEKSPTLRRFHSHYYSVAHKYYSVGHNNYNVGHKNVRLFILRWLRQISTSFNKNMATYGDNKMPPSVWLLCQTTGVVNTMDDEC